MIKIYNNLLNLNIILILDKTQKNSFSLQLVETISLTYNFLLMSSDTSFTSNVFQPLLPTQS